MQLKIYQVVPLVPDIRRIGYGINRDEIGLLAFLDEIYESNKVTQQVKNFQSV